MQSILTVTTAATDYKLLTMDELRQATGIASGKVTELTALEKRVADAIASRCNLRAAGASRKTLREETFSQAFRLDCPVESLILARRPATIVSVVEDTATVATTDYEIEPETGILRRLCNDYPSWWWACKKITVTFTAGWATVPDNLRNAAMKLATELCAESGHESNLKRESIPGVIEREWWVGPVDDPLFSGEVLDLLGDYINPSQA